jgi:hypothetical protein
MDTSVSSLQKECEKELIVYQLDSDCFERYNYTIFNELNNQGDDADNIKSIFLNGSLKYLLSSLFEKVHDKNVTSFYPECYLVYHSQCYLPYVQCALKPFKVWQMWKKGKVGNNYDHVKDMITEMVQAATNTLDGNYNNIFQPTIHTLIPLGKGWVWDITGTSNYIPLTYSTRTPYYTEAVNKFVEAHRIAGLIPPHLESKYISTLSRDYTGIILLYPGE